MTAPIMVNDPRWAAFQQAHADLADGLQAPAGATERYRHTQGPFVELIAEHTPPHARRHMIEALYDITHLSVGVIAIGFQATDEEIEPIRNRPPLEPEPPDETERLRQLPYHLYLRTEHWQRVRKAALARAENRCALCNTPEGLQVHHRSYDRKGSERSADVVVLCQTCHERHHGLLRAA